MFSFRRAFFFVLLFCHSSVSSRDLTGIEQTSVSCSQGLSHCTVEDKPFAQLAPENENIEVRKLTPRLELSCQDSALCWFCLRIDTELYIPPDTLQDSRTGSVTLCYATPPALPTCKKVAFTVNQDGLQKNLGKMSLVSNRPVGVSFGSAVHIHSLNPSTIPLQMISAPSLKEECLRQPPRNIEECRVPKIRTQINRDKNEVVLGFAETFSPTSVCVLYEQEGQCQAWPNSTIPLASVVPCLCIQSWYDGKPVRSRICPFLEEAFLFKNLWQNVTVFVSPAHMNSSGQVLLWNLSAPCKLGGKVWPCERKTGHCREIQGFGQQLDKRTWTQNKYGRWVYTGAFEDIDLQLSPCVMVTLVEKDHQLGPFCFTDTNRWHWSLLLVGLILMVFLAGVFICLFHGYIKGYIRGCCHYGFAKIGRRGHIVVISPPDVDAAVLESVCSLAASLTNHGFSVSVDQWCRTEQCRLGPLPWLHSQLLELNIQGGRVVLVLTRRALETTEEWTRQHNETVSTKPTNSPQTWSPYADIFTASLSLILADKQQGRTREQFLLANLDSGQPAGRLPELLEGIPFFQLPSQMQSLISQLTGTKFERRMCKLLKWHDCGRWRAKDKKTSQHTYIL